MVKQGNTTAQLNGSAQANTTDSSTTNKSQEASKDASQNQTTNQLTKQNDTKVEQIQSNTTLAPNQTVKKLIAVKKDGLTGDEFNDVDEKIEQAWDKWTTKVQKEL